MQEFQPTNDKKPKKIKIELLSFLEQMCESTDPQQKNLYDTWQTLANFIFVEANKTNDYNPLYLWMAVVAFAVVGEEVQLQLTEAERIANNQKEASYGGDELADTLADGSLYLYNKFDCENKVSALQLHVNITKTLCDLKYDIISTYEKAQLGLLAISGVTKFLASKLSPKEQQIQPTEKPASLLEMPESVPPWKQKIYNIALNVFYDALQKALPNISNRIDVLEMMDKAWSPLWSNVSSVCQTDQAFEILHYLDLLEPIALAKSKTIEEIPKIDQKVVNQFTTGSAEQKCQLVIAIVAAIAPDLNNQQRTQLLNALKEIDFLKPRLELRRGSSKNSFISFSQDDFSIDSDNNSTQQESLKKIEKLLVLIPLSTSFVSPIENILREYPDQKSILQKSSLFEWLKDFPKSIQNALQTTYYLCHDYSSCQSFWQLANDPKNEVSLKANNIFFLLNLIKAVSVTCQDLKEEQKEKLQTWHELLNQDRIKFLQEQTKAMNQLSNNNGDYTTYLLNKFIAASKITATVSGFWKTNEPYPSQGQTTTILELIKQHPKQSVSLKWQQELNNKKPNQKLIFNRLFSKPVIAKFLECEQKNLLENKLSKPFAEYLVNCYKLSILLPGSGHFSDFPSQEAQQFIQRLLGVHGKIARFSELTKYCQGHDSHCAKMFRVVLNNVPGLKEKLAYEKSEGFSSSNFSEYGCTFSEEKEKKKTKEITSNLCYSTEELLNEKNELAGPFPELSKKQNKENMQKNNI